MPFSLNMEDEMTQRLVLVVLILLGVLVLVRVGHKVVERLVSDPARLYATRKTIRRTGGLFAALLLVYAFSPGLGSVIQVLTIIGAGMAIALREVLLSWVGWMRIAFAQPYKQGDRIEVNGLRGDVIDIRAMRTTLMEIGGWVEADQSTGRIVHFPNNWLLLHEVYNYTRGFRFIWNEVQLVVTFRSDWQAAREIMRSLAEISAKVVEQQAAEEIHQMAREYLIHYSILTPFVYVRIVPNGVQLTLRYLCEARKRRGTEHALTVSMLEAFKQNGGIELAYPMMGVALPETPQFGPLPPASPNAAR